MLRYFHKLIGNDRLNKLLLSFLSLLKKEKKSFRDVEYSRECSSNAMSFCQICKFHDFSLPFFPLDLPVSVGAMFYVYVINV